MKAMVLEAAKQPLVYRRIDDPKPQAGQVLLKVHACGVCRTDLHIVDGELSEPKLPLIIGHQIVGTVIRCGPEADLFSPGDRVGVPWLGWSCGKCRYCRSGQENLCDDARYTGYQIDGGYAEMCVADERFCFAIPDGFGNLQAAPLLCAGLIGFRSYRMTGEAARLGFYGFGAAAHILIQVARHDKRKIYAFSKDGDTEAQEFARRLGADWAGGSSDHAPDELDAAIIFAPVGALVPAALKAVRKGGIVVCGGIHMSDIPTFPYSILWGERILRSVANLTRKDGEEFLSMAPRIPISSEVHTYPLEQANHALDDLRAGKFTGAAVIVVDADLNL